MNCKLVAFAVIFAFVPLANASPQIPDGVTERAIIVPGPVALPGTLTLPAGNGPFPGVVLVHGSGPGDRDETIGGNKPFRDIAWGLAARGVAVLRYDKRANVMPMWFATRPFTVVDEVIDDAVFALGVLRKQPEVAPARTFILGHSLGGMLAPRIAKADGKVAGIILLAGATRMKLPDQMERQFAYLVSIAGADSATVRQQVAPLVPAIAQVRALVPADTANLAPIPGLGGTSARYWLDLAAYDPATAMREIATPALVMQGMRDYQVPPEQLDDWLLAVGARPNLTVKRYPGLSHLFIMGSGTPGPADYAHAGRVDQQVTLDIATWIKSR